MATRVLVIDALLRVFVLLMLLMLLCEARLAQGCTPAALMVCSTVVPDGRDEALRCLERGVERKLGDRRKEGC